jgi:hypothetical protein
VTGKRSANTYAVIGAGRKFELEAQNKVTIVVKRVNIAGSMAPAQLVRSLPLNSDTKPSSLSASAVWTVQLPQNKSIGKTRPVKIMIFLFILNSPL